MSLLRPFIQSLVSWPLTSGEQLAIQVFVLVKTHSTWVGQYVCVCVCCYIPLLVSFTKTAIRPWNAEQQHTFFFVALEEYLTIAWVIIWVISWRKLITIVCFSCWKCRFGLNRLQQAAQYAKRPPQSKPNHVSLVSLQCRFSVSL